MTAPTPAMMGGAEAPPVVEDPAAPSMQSQALAGLPAFPTAGLPACPNAEMPALPSAETPARLSAETPASPSAETPACLEGSGTPARPQAGTRPVEMPPVPRADIWELGPRPPTRLGDQRGWRSTTHGQATAGTESGPGITGAGYVRLRLHLDGGCLSVAGARAVEGPLLQPVRLHAGLACEVVFEGRRVAVDSIPDLGIWRTLPPPGDQGGGSLAGHHVTELDAFDFHVRVPRADLPLAALPGVRVAVYRCKGDAPTVPIGPGTLAEQFPRELREVARIEGVRLWELAPDIQGELRAQLS
ncbi:MAG TPA: hypothetical protein VG276_31350 [Actinomycetes bacterium]|nr:hypothetical protein [Actinomycetes bacterium]